MISDPGRKVKKEDDFFNVFLLAVRQRPLVGLPFRRAVSPWGTAGPWDQGSLLQSTSHRHMVSGQRVFLSLP